MIAEAMAKVGKDGTITVEEARSVETTLEDLLGREQLPEAFRKKLDNFKYTQWTLFGLHHALHQAPSFAASAFDPNVDRAMKWSLGAETMQDLFSAHQDVAAGRIPKLVQFGSGPLSVLDPTQAPPGKHTTYAWHVMPLLDHMSDADFETFKEEFSDKIEEVYARYCPNMTKDNIIGRYAYTAREYILEMPNMRGGDIFMVSDDNFDVSVNSQGHSGETSVPPGSYRLDVNAMGNWTIRIAPGG